MTTDARVWAPLAAQVALHRVRGSEASRVEMIAEGEWWVAPEALELGDRYGFLLDSDENDGDEVDELSMNYQKMVDKETVEEPDVEETAEEEAVAGMLR